MHATARRRVSPRVALILALSLVGGLIAAWLSAGPVTTAHAAGQAVAIKAAPAALTRGFCIKSGTGEFRNLWLTGPGATCPAPFWGPVTIGGGAPGPAGPAGPAGPVGPAGTSSLASHNGVSHTAAGVAGNGVIAVSLSGMPGFSATAVRRSFVDVNAELLAVGVTASVGAPTAAPGATTWTYPVTVGGQGAATPAQTISVDVLTWLS